jgi:hypothetical protein
MALNIVIYAAFKERLDAVSALEGQLIPNELETYRSLALKYAEPVTPDPTDVACLDVIARNVEIRKGYNFDSKSDGGRVIDMPSKESDGKS